MKRFFITLMLIFAVSTVHAAPKAGTAPIVVPKFQYVDGDGDTYPGGKLYIYEVGTTTAKASFDESGNTNASPVVLDSDGVADVWVNGQFRAKLTDSDDVQVFDIDNLDSLHEIASYQISVSALAGRNFYYPSASASDHGVTGNNNTVKYYVDTIGSNEATLYFAHDPANATTTYTFSTAETIPQNIDFILEDGAVLSLGSGATLTFSGSPSQINAQPAQQIKTGDGTIRFTYGGTVYGSWAGANGTDSTDDTTEINDVLSWQKGAGGMCVFSDGTYVISEDETIIIPANVSLYGSGSDVTIFDATNWDGSGGSIDVAIFQAQGTIGSSLGSVSTAVDEGDIYIDTAADISGSVSAGDIIAIQRSGNASEGSWNKKVDGYDKGELGTVYAVDASGVTLIGGVHDSYATGVSTTIKKMTMSTSNIGGFTVLGPSATILKHVMRVERCANNTLSDIVIKQGDTRRLFVVDCFNTKIVNCIVKKLSADGASVQSACFDINGQSISLDNCIGQGYRHGISIGGGGTIVSRFIEVANSVIEGITNWACDNHGYAEYSTWYNNNISGGIALGGDYSTYHKNLVVPHSTSQKLILVDRIRGNTHNFVENHLLMPDGSSAQRVLDGTDSEYTTSMSVGGTFLFKDNIVESLDQDHINYIVFQNDGVTSECRFHFIDNEFRHLLPSSQLLTRTPITFLTGTQDFTELKIDNNTFENLGLGNCQDFDYIEVTNNFCDMFTGSGATTNSAPAGSFNVSGTGADMHILNNRIIGAANQLSLTGTGPSNECVFQGNSITLGSLASNNQAVSISTFVDVISSGNIIGHESGSQAQPITYSAITNLYRGMNTLLSPYSGTTVAPSVSATNDYVRSSFLVETISSTTAGVVAPEGLTKFDTTAGALAVTLATPDNIGGLKVFVMTTDGGSNAVLTVTNHETSDPEVFTFADVDDTLVLMPTGTEWITIKNSGVGI